MGFGWQKSTVGSIMIHTIPNFITDSEIDIILNYVMDPTTSWFKTDDHWTERFIHFGDIKDPLVKSVVETIVYRMGEEVAKTRSQSVKPETVQLVRWIPGDSLYPPHADGENTDGTPHPYSNRAYTGMVYLNDDFEGGQIYFPEHEYAPEITKSLFVHFTGGIQDLHGVTEITKGNRYTIAVFFEKN